MTQDSFFSAGEGDAWFQRNRACLLDRGRFDWPSFVLSQLDGLEAFDSVLELGCATGHRLARLQGERLPRARCVGVDASVEAVTEGASLYPGLELHHGLLAAPPVEGPFDLVIVNYVLHWVDRATLSRSVAAIDGLVRDGGFLLLGDFLPDYPQRRRYHHAPEAQIFTYKQDYAAIFVSLGLYQVVSRVTYNHDAEPSPTLTSAPSGSRGSCTLLRRSLHEHYPEVDR